MLVNIGKKIELDVDVERLPSEVLQRVIYMGLRNMLMDSHAGVTEAKHGDQVEAVSRAMAEKKLEALYAGELRTVQTERETDPVQKIALDFAEGVLRDWWKLNRPKEKLDNPRTRAAELLKKHPEWVEDAKKTYKKRQAINREIEISL
jgi:hypothetical protein